MLASPSVWGKLFQETPVTPKMMRALLVTEAENLVTKDVEKVLSYFDVSGFFAGKVWFRDHRQPECSVTLGKERPPTVESDRVMSSLRKQDTNNDLDAWRIDQTTSQRPLLAELLCFWSAYYLNVLCSEILSVIRARCTKINHYTVWVLAADTLVWSLFQVSVALWHGSNAGLPRGVFRGVSKRKGRAVTN